VKLFKLSPIEWVVIAGIILVLRALGPCFFPFEALFYVLIGWAFYLYRVVPEIAVSWSGVATAVVCLLLLAVGLHRFLRWLYTAEHQQGAEPARVWPVRWTAAVLGVVVLMFVAGIAAVGVAHQATWLATAPEPFLDAGDARVRTYTSNQLHQLALSLQDYTQDHNGVMPPHATFSPDGQPLLSWRVLILPYIEEEALFKKFRLDETWDSPHNLRLLPRMPETFRPLPDRRKPGDHFTTFQVFVGKGAAFEGREGLRFPGEFPDGPGNTILIVEAANAVPWTKPADLSYYPHGPLPPLGALSPGFFVVAMADASVRKVDRKGLTEATLRAAITRNGNDVLGSDW
jgi:hypothetical protein